MAYTNCMTAKDIKAEAKKKLAPNMHQAIVIYTVEFTLFITLIALVVISCVCFGVSKAASIVMICYGVLLGLLAIVGAGMLGFAMSDFYLTTYRCKPYAVRRLGEALARSNITKILLLSLKRTLISILLTLCLVIPGIIYIIRTSMAGYLLMANPKMSASAALSASNKVMSGRTGAYFSLAMSMIGWYVLGILTLGLGFIFIRPYLNMVKAVYYKRNLQGDKNVYVYQPLQQGYVTAGGGMPASGVETVAVDAARRADAPVTGSAEQQKQVAGPAPVDALAEEDVMDMNAAIRDFGTGAIDGASQTADVPEVPIAPVPSKKKEGGRTAAQAEPDTASHSHVIDGTGIVETERVLTTREINESAALRQQAIDRIYVNSKPDRPVVDYFSGEGNQSPDDFGVPDVETEAAEKSGSADSAEAPQTEEPPDVSDSDFDSFLRLFDEAAPAETPSVQGAEERVQPAAASSSAETPRARTGATRESSSVRTSAAQSAHTARPTAPANADERRAAAEQRRKEAEERIARDRAASEERRARMRENARSGFTTRDSADRAERIRRERERRADKPDT